MEIVIVSRDRVTARVLYVTRGDKRHFRLSWLRCSSPFLSFSLSFPLAFSVLLSMKLGELGQHRKSIITKRGVMTQMLKSRSLRAKLFSVSYDTAIPYLFLSLLFYPVLYYPNPFWIWGNIFQINNTLKKNTLQSNSTLTEFKCLR